VIEVGGRRLEIHKQQQQQQAIMAVKHINKGYGSSGYTLLVTTIVSPERMR